MSESCLTTVTKPFSFLSHCKVSCDSPCCQSVCGETSIRSKVASSSLRFASRSVASSSQTPRFPDSDFFMPESSRPAIGSVPTIPRALAKQAGLTSSGVVPRGLGGGFWGGGDFQCHGCLMTTEPLKYIHPSSPLPKQKA